MPATVRAQDTAIHLNLPEQPLGRALLQFGEQASLQVFFMQDAVAGLTAPALSGLLTPAEALGRLLQGTGLEYARNGANVTVSRRDGAAMMDAVQVTGDGIASEGRDTYTANYASLARGVSIRETPQSISVMTRQRIDDQALISVGDVLGQTTGMTVVAADNGEVSKVYARGFAVESMMIDGVALDGYQQKYFNPNLAMYDRVEVIRGADGLFSGTGEPGGAINLVRKRPLAYSQVNLTTSAGSWDNYRAEVDATGPLAANGKLRGRGVVAYQDRDYFYGNADASSQFVYGILEADVAERTKVAIGGSYEKRKTTPWQSGLPRSPDGADLGLPRRTVLNASWNNLESDHKEIFAQIEQGLGRDWKLKLDAQYINRKSYEESADGYGAVDPATGMGNRMDVWAFDFDNEVKALDLSLSGNFDLLGQTHQLLIGGDWRQVRHSNAYYAADYETDPPEVPIREFSPGIVPRPSRFWKSNDWPDFGAKQYGVYGRIKLSLSDRVKIFGGGRLSTYDYISPFKRYNSSGDVTTSSVTTYRESGIFTPYGGMTVDLNEQWTAYGSVTMIHKSQANRLSGPIPGSPLDAITGKNYEIGLKGEHGGGRLNSAFALYRIERKGEAVRDPSYPSTNVGNEGLNCCWLRQGNVLSEGFDAEITGELMPGWQLAAGYTYNRNQNQNTSSVYNSVTPRHLFKLWTTYRLPDTLSAWTVGGGVTVQSAHYVSGTARSYNASSGKYDGASVPFNFTQAGYAVASASVQYAFTPNWKATLNINNLFDRTYYKTMGTSGSGNWYGDPRNFYLTLRGTF
ncbi:TonB-dependent siderophore receptor [Achromobacter deleyi]|uniref:TonB-dependent siderophore receptor n=1 Tax=Achromobacter deleyi TaxID=1353891 RepID=UPI00149128E0|nr:TonB-dependent siderophore receptor [Achromobacter deleyi]QVQ26760.1 TonB-dependent siderophore receptor [Achromobacter deleyi]UIP22336.1 TonB-dependent siderophore receptor [Achromobacter deleyi]